MVTAARWLMILAAIALSPLYALWVAGGLWLDSRGPSSAEDAVRLTAVVAGLCIAGLAFIAHLR